MCVRVGGEVLFWHCKERGGAVKVCLEMKDVLQIAIGNSTVSAVIQTNVNIIITVIMKNEIYVVFTF